LIINNNDIILQFYKNSLLILYINSLTTIKYSKINTRDWIKECLLPINYLWSINTDSSTI